MEDVLNTGGEDYATDAFKGGKNFLEGLTIPCLTCENLEDKLISS